MELSYWCDGAGYFPIRVLFPLYRHNLPIIHFLINKINTLHFYAFIVMYKVVEQP